MATTQQEEDFLLANVSGNVVPLSQDSNGTHVVQAIIKNFREERIAGFVKEVTVSSKVLLQVACNCHGICVIKALIEKTKTYRQALQALLIRVSPELTQDPFGNYAIQ